MADLFSTIIKKFSNYNDPAGVASASPGTKTVKSALDQTDPQRKSQILPQFATQIQQIINMMGIISMGSSAVSSTPSQQVSNNIANTANVVSSNLYSNSTSSALVTAFPDTRITNTLIGAKITGTVSEIMQIGLANALAMESQKRGLFKTMGVMASVLNNPQYFGLLSRDYQTIIINAFSQFENNFEQYGLSNYPILQAPIIVVGNNIPSPLVDIVPDFYAQVFYHPNTDPYPGYVQYHNISDFNVILYTIRDDNNPPFSDASELFVYTTEQSFVFELDPYIVQANLSIASLASVMTDVLNQLLESWHNTLLGTNSQNSVLNGNTIVSNTTINSSSGTNNLVAQLLPWLNTMIQKADSDHLPNSVLDKGAIQQLLNKHGDQCAKMKMCQQYGQQALQKGAGGTGPTSDNIG